MPPLKRGYNPVFSNFPEVVVIWSVVMLTGSSRLVKDWAVTWLAQHGMVGETREGKPLNTEEIVD